MAGRRRRARPRCSPGRPPTWTSSSTATRARPRARSHARPAARRASRSPRSSAPGAWSRATAPGRSTSSRCAAAQHRGRPRAARLHASTRSPSRSPAGAPIDPLGGIADLRAGRLRMAAPGAFAADPLRVLRLVRLAVELDLQADAETMRAARAHADGLNGVSAERVFVELRRIIAARARALGTGDDERAGRERGGPAGARGAARRAADSLSPPRCATDTRSRCSIAPSS